MPYGGIERPEQSVSQATVEARRLVRGEREQFECDYKNGRLVATAFPDLAQITEAFAAAGRAQAAPVLSDAQVASCRRLLEEARAAIRAANAEDFGFALGPNLASFKRKYAEDTNALQWKYVTRLTQLAIVMRREAVLLHFASQNNYPDALTARQQQDLKVMLSAEFDPTDPEKKFIIPDAWGIKQEFLGLMQDEADSLFKQEYDGIQSESSITHLSFALLKNKQAIKEIKIEIAKIKIARKKYQCDFDGLDELARQDASLMRNDAGDSWKFFRRSHARYPNLERRIQELQESGLPFVALAELEANGESLLELAAQQYGATQDSTHKANLRRIMDSLASHGSTPPSQEASFEFLDWRALMRIIPHVSALTPKVADIRVNLQGLVKERREEADSSVRSRGRRAIHSVAAIQAHEAACKYLAFVLFVSAAQAPAIQRQRVLRAAEEELSARRAADKFQLIGPRPFKRVQAWLSTAAHTVFAQGRPAPQELQPLHSRQVNRYGT